VKHYCIILYYIILYYIILYYIILYYIILYYIILYYIILYYIVATSSRLCRTLSGLSLNLLQIFQPDDSLPMPKLVATI